MKTKEDIRWEIQWLFQGNKTHNREVSDKNIMEKILWYVEGKNISTICLYESLSDEVDTKIIIQKLSNKWYKILVPKMISPTEMILIEISSRKPYSWEIDIFFIPGRAFSLKNDRLGRGKWYYDRFLSQKKYNKSKKIGVCYDFQILENIPVEEYDVTMNSLMHS